MRRSTRLVPAALGLAVAAWSAFQWEPTRITQAYVVGEAAADGQPAFTDCVRIEEGFRLPWHAVAAIVAGLAVAGYAFFGGRRASA